MYFPSETGDQRRRGDSKHQTTALESFVIATHQASQQRALQKRQTARFLTYRWEGETGFTSPPASSSLSGSQSGRGQGGSKQILMDCQVAAGWGPGLLECQPMSPLITRVGMSSGRATRESPGRYGCVQRVQSRKNWRYLAGFFRHEI